MTVWPQHTSVSRRENTMRSSCKPDRYFPRSAVEAASNRPGWSELGGEKNTVFLNVMRLYITATHLPWFGTGYLYLHSAYVLMKGMLGESWRKQELGRLTAAVGGCSLSLGCTAHACVRSPRYKCSSAMNTISWNSLFMVLPA